MHSRSKVFLTGAEGFTGRHLIDYLRKQGCIVGCLTCDIADAEKVQKELLEFSPRFVIHLAGISFTTHSNLEEIYRVNVVGTTNLLDACAMSSSIKGVILASSAAVYGEQGLEVLDEELCPRPVSHYACSKLSVEFMSHQYSNYFPITVVRPFNYTGVGHHQQFVVPKIVSAFASGQDEVQLGNLDVAREFNDVRDVCKLYFELLEFKHDYCVTNLCSGRAITLQTIVDLLVNISGKSIRVETNPNFVRQNEIKKLSGDVSRLRLLTSAEFKYNIEDTLTWMWESSC